MNDKNFSEPSFRSGNGLRNEAARQLLSSGSQREDLPMPILFWLLGIPIPLIIQYLLLR